MKDLIKGILKKSDKLHWTTVLTERALIALIGFCTVIAVGDYLFGMWIAQTVALADLFMLFIFAEVVAMIGAFYNTERIPVTLPIIIAITALCRLIVLLPAFMCSVCYATFCFVRFVDNAFCTTFKC